MKRVEAAEARQKFDRDLHTGPSKRPVLLIDGGDRADIGVIRSLGWGGIPIHLLASDPRSTSLASRYLTQKHPFPGLHRADELTIAAIRTAVKTIGQRPVMLATGDRALALLSRNRDELAELVDHDLAPAAVIETCLNKDQFAPVARQLGLPVPETCVPKTAADARLLAETVEYPIFVKPVQRADWEKLPCGVIRSVKGQRYDSRDEFSQLLDAVEAQGFTPFVIQRFVAGGDEEHMSVHAYVNPDGTIAGTFTGTKLRVYPPGAGVGVHVTSTRLAEPERMARQILTALGYRGFAILQFKRNTRCNRYELLEINCRYSTWSELPSRAGCNFPLAAYATITGTPLPKLEQREGISWLDTERDLHGMIAYHSSGEWTWGSYLRSLSTVRCWAYFAWDDPLPLFQKLRNR